MTKSLWLCLILINLGPFGGPTVLRLLFHIYVWPLFSFSTENLDRTKPILADVVDFENMTCVRGLAMQSQQGL
jgi:hypothetical protein